MSFGLSDEEYQFLLDDINRVVEGGNRKYGYGGLGDIDMDGNHYPLPHNNTSRKLRSRHRKSCTEKVAIARGLIKIHRPAKTTKMETLK